jgi:hypothetical protein
MSDSVNELTPTPSVMSPKHQALNGGVDEVVSHAQHVRAQGFEGHSRGVAPECFRQLGEVFAGREREDDGHGAHPNRHADWTPSLFALI